MKRIFRRLLSLYVLIGLGLAHQAYPMQIVKNFINNSSDIPFIGSICAEITLGSYALLSLSKKHYISNIFFAGKIIGGGLAAGLIASGIRNILSTFPQTAPNTFNITFEPIVQGGLGTEGPGIKFVSNDRPDGITMRLDEETRCRSIHGRNPRQENMGIWIDTRNTRNKKFYASPDSDIQYSVRGDHTYDFNCNNTPDAQELHPGKFVFLSPKSKKQFRIKGALQLLAGAGLTYLGYKYL